LIHTGMDQFEITISMVNYLLYVIIIMLIYGIKIIRKMPIILTYLWKGNNLYNCSICELCEIVLYSLIFWYLNLYHYMIY
jgi:hypothetical protein